MGDDNKGVYVGGAYFGPEGGDESKGGLQSMNDWYAEQQQQPDIGDSVSVSPSGDAGAGQPRGLERYIHPHGDTIVQQGAGLERYLDPTRGNFSGQNWGNVAQAAGDTGKSNGPITVGASGYIDPNGVPANGISDAPNYASSPTMDQRMAAVAEKKRLQIRQKIIEQRYNEAHAAALQAALDQEDRDDAASAKLSHNPITRALRGVVAEIESKGLQGTAGLLRIDDAISPSSIIQRAITGEQRTPYRQFIDDLSATGRTMPAYLQVPSNSQGSLPDQAAKWAGDKLLDENLDRYAGPEAKYVLDFLNNTEQGYQGETKQQINAIPYIDESKQQRQPRYREYYSGKVPVPATLEMDSDKALMRSLPRAFASTAVDVVSDQAGDKLKKIGDNNKKAAALVANKMVKEVLKRLIDKGKLTPSDLHDAEWAGPEIFEESNPSDIHQFEISAPLRRADNPPKMVPTVR